MTGTTPVPNKLFDYCLRDLREAEIKLLLIINRQTLGWKDRRNVSGRKERDWISTSQIVSKSGCSRRAISLAVDSLVKKRFIMVFDESGFPLVEATSRKGKMKLFYCLAPTLLSPVDNKWTTSGKGDEKNTTCVNNADALSKNISSLAQKMLITK